MSSPTPSPSSFSSDLSVKTFQGEQVPSVGFGTFQLRGRECRDAVITALETGYRHIDTARMYQNEEQVGQAWREARVDRKDFFLTSKVWRDSLQPHRVPEEVETSLRDLQTDYLDLVLIHWPNDEVPLEDTLDALVSLKEEQKIRHLGLSNFPSKLMLRALNHAPVFTNQVEYHPLLGQNTLHALAEEHDFMLTAYSPLAHGVVFQNSTLADIGRKHDKDAGQVALRWLLEQSNTVVLPRSRNPDHIRGNFELFDFSLDQEDLDRIGALPKDQRQINPSFAPAWDPA